VLLPGSGADRLTRHGIGLGPGEDGELWLRAGGDDRLIKRQLGDRGHTSTPTAGLHTATSPASTTTARWFVVGPGQGA
jgi:hypothetical protein